MFGRDSDDCACETRFDGETLRLDGADCPGDGELAAAPACRATAVRALRDREATAVHTAANGLQRAYEADASTLLVAAGRFAERAGFHDERLAARAERDPLGAARAATGRAGPVARIAAETGLAACREAVDGYDDALRPRVAPEVGTARVLARPPPDARLVDRYELQTGAVVRRYDRPTDPLATYHLTPVELTLDAGATETLAAAAEYLAEAALVGERAAGRAVRAVADHDTDVATLRAVLEKHTSGLGVLSDLFADPAVSDAYVSAPAPDAPVRLEADDDPLRSNVYLTEASTAALASRFRRESGSAFSRADPTLDATVETADREVRVAAVTDPVSDGHGFAFRVHDGERFRLPALVANGTVPPPVAGLLSVAVRRDAAVLIAGGRGVGKTTLLGALLPELAAGTRTVVVEDTPELPVESLRSVGRDCQRLHVDRDGEGLGPTDAVRTALRLGEGALVVGEVRGREAEALYEAMRVGAGGATLGTVHGDGPEAVRERVVTDLGVSPSAFADTDLVVTLDRTADRRVSSVVEVVGRDTPEFAPVYADGPTGRIDRGNAATIASLATPDETYADVRNVVETRAAAFE